MLNCSSVQMIISTRYEWYNTSIVMTKIPFNVSARTARLIGRENVGNPQAAIIELVKNGYDADAESVRLFFDGKFLFIADSGDGMSSDTIARHWMTIGTDNKDSLPISQKGRVKSGAKGIGRFALDKLGNTVEMLTKTTDSDTAYKWFINWELFEKQGASLSDVSADLEEISAGEFEKALGDLGIKDNSHGTVFKIGVLRDNWDEFELDDLFNALESLVPNMENDIFSINMKVSKYPQKYGEVSPIMASDFDYKVEAAYSQSGREIKLKIFRNELEVDKLRTKFHGIFTRPEMQKPDFQLQAFEKGFITKTIQLDQLIGEEVDENSVKSIGDFNFNFIFVKNQLSAEDRKKNPFTTVDYGVRSEWIKKFGGIRIYRDNFRVRPYGERGDDWLGLGERQAKSPQGAGQRIGAYRIRPNQIAGAVKISRLDSLGLQDKSSREGIHEDSSFKLLKTILTAIINQFEIDRNVIQYSIAQEFKIIDRPAAARADGEKALKTVQSGHEVSGHENKQNADALANYVVTLKDENQDQKEEIRILRSLASSGLVTAAAAHELWGYRNQLDTRASNLRSALGKYLPEKSIPMDERIYNPYVHVDAIENTDRHIAGWLNYALKPIRKDRRSAKKVFVDDYLESLHDSWDYLLESKKAKLELGPVPSEVAIQMYPIDLDSIFNNLIVNSLDSFLQSKDTTIRKISVNAHLIGKKITLVYEDTGDGLATEFTQNPEQIFLPHVTSKRNNRTGEITGTGMGMYIVKMIIDECDGEIELKPSDSGFKVEIRFKVSV